jgi:hypothetical protein
LYRIFVFVFCISFFIAPFLPAADSTQQLFQILQLVSNKQYPEAISGYRKYMRTAEPWFQGPIQFEIATLQAGLGEKSKALDTMEEAIQSGFDDCFAVKQYPEWNAFRNDFRFATLHAKMQIAEADYKELAWLKSEIEYVKHDTTTMIAENINRLDTNSTEIPQSEIPTRQTSSTGVLFSRELLKVTLAAQRYYVSLSDKQRIQHVGTMQVLSGTGLNPQVLQSAHLAEQAAERRKQAIQQRKFSLPPTVGTEPRACIEF